MTFCTSCGTQNLDGVKFCVNCGAALASAASEPGTWRDSSEDPAAPEANRPTASSYVVPPFPTSPYPAYNAGLASTAIGPTYATWGERVPGALIDAVLNIVVLGVLFGVLSIFSAAFGSISETLGNIVGCFSFLLVQLANLAFGIFNKVYLVNQRGSSIGQGVMNLEVVTKEGAKPAMGPLWIRLLATIGLGLVPCIGSLLDYLWPLWDEQNQTLHDKAAGTFVVKKS